MREKSKIEKGKEFDITVWSLIISLFIILVFTFSFELFTKQNYSNPPCYYFFSENEIKLFGVDKSQNHSIIVLKSFDKTKLIVLDQITDPPTEIPLCIK